ncbi:YbaY family lipoprotein [Methanolobus sp. ZRKC3]|uniref:YbaY family lipoprotein n=1 Tax=Methanolobus sp. ZRKC3 TaxID=3125786 RepID=UPI0032512E72
MKLDITKIGFVLIIILLSVIALTLPADDTTQDMATDTSRTVSGSISIADIVETFEDVTVYIELRDVSLMDAPSVLIAETTISGISASEADSLSIPYSISHPELDERMTYSIFAFVDVDGDKEVSQKDYISTWHNDVSADSDNSDVNVELEYIKPYDDNPEKLPPIEMEVTISQIEYQEGITQLLCIGGELYDEIELNVGVWTQITDEDENELIIDDLKEGMKIHAYFGPAVTRSIPPQSSAEKIVVIAE